MFNQWDESWHQTVTDDCEHLLKKDDRKLLPLTRNPIEI